MNRFGTGQKDSLDLLPPLAGSLEELNLSETCLRAFPSQVCGTQRHRGSGSSGSSSSSSRSSSSSSSWRGDEEHHGKADSSQARGGHARKSRCCTAARRQGTQLNVSTKRGQCAFLPASHMSPLQISALTRLKVLYLHNAWHRSAGLLPSDWDALRPLATSLRFLSISGNRLEAVPPAVLGMPRLLVRGLGRSGIWVGIVCCFSPGYPARSAHAAALATKLAQPTPQL